MGFIRKALIACLLSSLVLSTGCRKKQNTVVVTSAPPPQSAPVEVVSLPPIVTTTPVTTNNQVPTDDTPQRNAMRITAAEIVGILQSPSIKDLTSMQLYSRVKASTKLLFMYSVIDGVFVAAGVPKDQSAPVTAEQVQTLIKAFDAVGE